MNRILLTALLLFAALQGCSPSTEVEIDPLPRNVIFILADGMGLTQISTSLYANGGPSVFARFRHLGLITTHSTDNLITDSAAGATAFATGTKTYNRAIAVDTGHQELVTIFEQAEHEGIQTGLVVTSTVTHATPACFYAHDTLRINYENIAAEMANFPLEVAIGYGYDQFAPETRSDSLDLIAMMEHTGTSIYTSLDQIPDSASVPLAVLLRGEEAEAPDRPAHFLRDGSLKAIGLLEAESSPFMLLIEGSQIDWAGHGRDQDYLLAEMKDFEEMLDAVLDWAESDGETLVVVTADHETGGLSLNGGTPPVGHNPVDTLWTSFSHGSHSGTLIPVFASGPGAENFSGMYDNTGIYHRMHELLIPLP